MEMIDLSRNQKEEIRNKRDEEPLGLVILAMLPFAVGFWLLLETAL